MRQRPPPRRASRPERSDAELRSITGFSTGSSSFRARKRAVQRGRRTCCRVLLEPRFTESFRVGSRSRRPPDPDRPAPAIPCVTVVTRRLVSLARGFGFRHLGDEPGAKVTYVLEHRSHRPVVGVGHVAREHGVARSDDLVEPEQPVRVDGLRPLRAYSSASATSAAARSFSTTVYPSRSATTRSTSGYT
jgi:hypothetical protein